MSLVRFIGMDVEGEGYVFVRRGLMYHYGKGEEKGLLVATTHAAAKTLLKRFPTIGPELSIAAIGSVTGKTFEQHLDELETAGGAGCYLWDGYTLDYYV